MAGMSMNRAIHGAVRRDLTHHHEGEHRIAWPALQKVGVAPELLTALDAEHDVMAAALADARAALEVLTRSPGAPEASAALGAMQNLRQVTVAHLEHEEAEIEPVYLANQQAPEIKAMGKEFAKVSPARGGRFFAWVLDGASPEERAAVTGEVPGPVLTVLTTVFGRGYRKRVAPVWR